MGSSTLQFSGVTAFNWDALAAQQRADVDAANAVHGGPALDFSDEDPPSADDTLADADERQRQRNADVMSGGYGSGPVARGEDGVYRGSGSPDYGPRLTEGDMRALYGPSPQVRYSNPSTDWSNFGAGFSGGGSMGGGSTASQRIGGAGGGGISGGGSMAGPGTVGVGTAYRDQVSMPSAPQFEAPTPYTPRAMETQMYDKLKELVTNPNAFLDDSVYKMLLAQGEQALGRSSGAKRMRFAGKTLDDFQTLGQRTAGQYYNQRLNQLMGGAGEERSRYSAQEGAERGAWGANANVTMAKNNQAMEAWRGQMGTYGSRLQDAWNRDQAAAGTQWNRLQAASNFANPFVRAADPGQAIESLKSWGMSVPDNLYMQDPRYSNRIQFNPTTGRNELDRGGRIGANGLWETL